MNSQKLNGESTPQYTYEWGCVIMRDSNQPWILNILDYGINNLIFTKIAYSII